MSTNDIITLAISGIAAGAAVGSWLWAKRAAASAAKATEIEAQRRHVELEPMFDMTWRKSGGSRAQIEIKLVGPPGLGRLDSVLVVVRDDSLDHSSRNAGGPSAEDLEAQIWGPMRFTPSVDGAPETGRSVAPFALDRGGSRPLSMQENPAPPWSGSDPSWWTRQYAGKPILLTIECHAGDQMWTVPLELQRRPVFVSRSYPAGELGVQDEIGLRAAEELLALVGECVAQVPIVFVLDSRADSPLWHSERTDALRPVTERLAHFAYARLPLLPDPDVRDGFRAFQAACESLAGTSLTSGLLNDAVKRVRDIAAKLRAALVDYTGGAD